MPISYDNSFWDRYQLQKPSLECLNPNGEYYNALIYQPHYNLEYGKDFLKIGEKEWDIGLKKFVSFFTMAQTSHLAICPEYSCPWEALIICFEQKILPATDGVFVIGCASIKAKELDNFFEKINGINNDVVFVYEKEKVEKNIDNALFFDIACTIFHSKAKDGTDKVIVIVQMKTESFGGKESVWEMEGFIKGEKIYIVENAVQSVSLITLICSDSLQDLNFEGLLPNYQYLPYLIIQIQLNQVPFQMNYCNHRRISFQKRRRMKDFISVNWARNLTLNGNAEVWNTYGGSAFYCPIDYPINLDDDRINENHALGIYYSQWRDFRAHAFYFNYDESIIHFQATKASRETAPAEHRVRPGGLKAIDSFIWNNESGKWASHQLNDGFVSLCEEIENEYGSLDCIKNNERKIDVERLVTLSNGEIDNEKWYDPPFLFSFQAMDTETNRRITFTQDPEENQKKIRTDQLIRYGTLRNMVIGKELPAVIKDLEGNVLLDFRRSKGKYFNMYPVKEGMSTAPAIGIYMGFSTSLKANIKFDNISAILEKANNNTARLVVWYHTNTNAEIQLHHITSKQRSDILKNAEKGRGDILTTQEK